MKRIFYGVGALVWGALTIQVSRHAWAAASPVFFAPDVLDRSDVSIIAVAMFLTTVTMLKSFVRGDDDE